MMQKQIVLSVICFSMVILGDAGVLEEPPKGLQLFHEIAVQHKPGLREAFNALKPEERVLMYYLYRASLPGHRLYADQAHRHAPEILDLFEYILEHKEQLKENRAHLNFDVDQFNDDVLTYLVYLWTNHGQYFMKEHVNEKRTPERIKCRALTQEHLQEVVRILGYDQPIDHLMRSIFDHNHEPTQCVPGDINASAVNIYHPAFTHEDYEVLPADERSSLNVYFDIQKKDGVRKSVIRTYKIGGMYHRELGVCAHWLRKARDHARAHPELFDEHMGNSLALLIEFLETGDEELFKKHSIAWTKTNNMLDYVWGWIETYQDPENRRGMFEADVTAKTVNMDIFKALLPKLEQRLPFPDAYKREDFNAPSAIPNVSINTKLYSTGGLGPLEITAAYCLPNYAELRSKHGAKQVMYEQTDGLAKLINKDLFNSLFYLPEELKWLKKYDPENTLHKVIWKVHVILHETLGHGSGRLATHRFKEGDKMIIGNITYNIGDEIPVTSKNITEFLADGSSLEELRAEIIALYTSIFNFDELAQAGLFDDWPQRIGKDRLIEELIKDMALTAHRRLLSQPKDSIEIRGAHARANTTIMNWLLDGGGLEIVKEEVEIDTQKYDVLGFKVKDVKQVYIDITKLAQLVQRIKSTGDGKALEELMEACGKYVRNPEHRDILQRNREAVVGDLKVIATLFPDYRPVIKDGHVVDVKASWPKDIVKQNIRHKKLASSTQ